MKTSIAFLLLLVLMIVCLSFAKKNSTRVNEDIEQNCFDSIKIAYWIDTTTSDKKFLKVFSTPLNYFQNMQAQWGKGNSKFNIDLDEYFGYKLGVPYKGELNYFTKESFVVQQSCGTECSFITVFNINRNKPKWIGSYCLPTYPGCYIENPSLVVATITDSGRLILDKLLVLNIDTWLGDTLDLGYHWMGSDVPFKAKQDSINISNGYITIFQFDPSSGKPEKRFKKKLQLK